MLTLAFAQHYEDALASRRALKVLLLLLPLILAITPLALPSYHLHCITCMQSPSILEQQIRAQNRKLNQTAITTHFIHRLHDYKQPHVARDH